jgi:NADPH:quinone reductase-like Zn-dependent oxidoreductase
MPYVARSQFGLRKPKSSLFGVDFAGTVEAVGSSVTGFQLGDEVFGARTGAFAEFLAVRDGVALKPANVTFEAAAAAPVAGLTALQGLRDKARLRPGHRVLVNGASGGVGTFAVQVAKALGAEVTAVCSTRNVERARELGADRVIDYTREDFTRSGDRYDVLFDVAGSRAWSESKRVLEPDGVMVMAGAPRGSGLLGPVGYIVKVRLGAIRSSQKVVNFVSDIDGPDLAALGELLESGMVKPVIDRRYELSELADALRYMGDGHAQGKLVVTV